MERKVYFRCNIIAIFLFVLFLVLSGCSSGGYQDIPVQTEEEAAGGMSVTDERGFERQLTPAEIAYQSAEQFLAVGNYEEAVRELQKATSLKPDYLEAWSELGKTLTKIKDYAGGIEAYKRALELSPGNEALIASIGYNYLFLEDWDNAEKYYRMLIEQDSLSYDGNVHLGFIYQKRGDDDTAIRYYKLALKSRPDDATTMGTLAHLYDKKGDVDTKIKYLQMAVEAAPDNYKFKYQLGSAYIDKRDFDSAIPIFEELTEKYPDRAGYWRYLGLALSQTDRKSEAPAALEKALELKGDDAYLLAVMAQVYNELKQPGNAIKAVKRGLKAGNGQEAFLYYQWGLALSKMKSYDESIAKFNKVLTYKDPLWSKYARKQIKRVETLKKIEKAKREQGL